MNIKDVMISVGNWGQKHAPQIATGFSIASGLAAVGFAFWKADKVKQRIQDHKDRMEELHKNVKMMGDELTPTERRQLVTAEFVKTGLEITKVVWPIVVFEAVSIGTKVYSQVVSDRRYSRATLALASALSTIGAYRKRVAEKIGVEEERKLYSGEEVEEIEIVELDEKGKEKITKETRHSYNPIDPYSITFEDQPLNDDGTINILVGSKYFKRYESNQLRYDFLKGIWRQCNNKLIAEGKLYLAEVYDLLGYEGYYHDKQRLDMAREVGWVYNKHNQAGDPFVSFGIEDPEEEHVKRFLNGDDDNILLEFNCMGAINGEVIKQYSDGITFFRN